MSGTDHSKDNEVIQDIIKTNKENIQPLKPTRKSVLKVLDPFYASSPTKSQVTKHVTIEESATDDSWAFLKIDNAVETPNTPKTTPFFIDPHTSHLDIHNITNISQFLNETVQEENIAVDDLLSMGSTDKFVSMETVNEIRRFHKSQVSRCNQKLESEVEMAKKSAVSASKEFMDAKILDLLKKNDANIELLKENYHRMISHKSIEIVKLQKDLSVADFQKLDNLFAVDIYYDTCMDLAKENTDVKKSSEEAYSFTQQTMKKYDKSVEIINIQKKNNQILLEEIETLRIKVGTVSLMLKEKELSSASDKEIYENELKNITNLVSKMLESESKIEREMINRAQLLGQLKSDMNIMQSRKSQI